MQSSRVHVRVKPSASRESRLKIVKWVDFVLFLKEITMSRFGTVYLAYEGKKLLGVFGSEGEAVNSPVVTGGYGARVVQTSWGWTVQARRGLVVIYPRDLNPTVDYPEPK